MRLISDYIDKLTWQPRRAASSTGVQVSSACWCCLYLSPWWGTRTPEPSAFYTHQH